MGLAVRGRGKDKVISKSGRGKKCAAPMRTSTSQCSPDVRVNGIGAVRDGDKVKMHNRKGCGPDISGASGKSKVVINGKNAVVIGGKYSSDNIITSGSSDVIFGRQSSVYAVSNNNPYGSPTRLEYKIRS